MEFIDQIHDHRDVFVLIGLAGAGKSTAADIIAEKHDERVATFEVSDFVRTSFEDQHVDDVNDNELGEWAAKKKEEEGQDYFVRKMAESIKGPSTPHVVISGVRSPEEAVAVEEVFGDCITIGIWTMPDIRFNRKYESDLSVDNDDYQTFQERNERELWEWGAVEFFSNKSIHTADYIVPNHGTISTLRDNIERLLDGRGAYGQNPFPYDDYKYVAQYL